MADNFLKQLRWEAQQRVGEVDPFNRVMWNDDLPSEIAMSQYTFLFSGPPTYTAAVASIGEGDTQLRPIGLIQQASYQPQRQMIPLPELGNRHYRHVPGRWSHGATLSRVMAKSGNLIGMLYPWLLHLGMTPSVNPFPDTEPGAAPGRLDRMVATVDTDLLDYPFGLYLVTMTEAGETISAEYWEKCLLVGYSKPIDAGQAVIIESVQLVFGRPVAAKNHLKMKNGQPFVDFTTAGSSGDDGATTDLPGN